MCVGDDYDKDINKVYYKIYLGRDDLIYVVCMQWFNEDDYRKDRFYYDNEGKIPKFDTEESAIIFVNNKFKPEYINPEYRRLANCWKRMELD